MEEKTVEITVQEYHELLRQAERIATVGRFIETTDYINVVELKALLGIRERGRNE